MDSECVSNTVNTCINFYHLCFHFYFFHRNAPQNGAVDLKGNKFKLLSVQNLKISALEFSLLTDTVQQTVKSPHDTNFLEKEKHRTPDRNAFFRCSGPGPSRNQLNTAKKQHHTTRVHVHVGCVCVLLFSGNHPERAL